MMNDLTLRKLRFVIMPTRFVPVKKNDDLNMAYSCWKEVWDFACKKEMNVMGPLYSDNFSRQSHVAVVFYNNEPMVLTTLNFLNLSSRMDLDDSYFSVWTKDSLDKLKENSSLIMTCGNLALNFNFRQGRLGVSGKDLVFALLVQYLKYSNRDSMVAAVRLEKGMERAAYRTGAYCLEADLPYSIPGQRVDLVCWHRTLDEKKIDSELNEVVKHIWLNSTELINVPSKQGVKDVA